MFWKKKKEEAKETPQDQNEVSKTEIGNETTYSVPETPNEAPVSAVVGEENKEEYSSVGWREMKYLKRANYEKMHKISKQSYVIKNIKKKKIAEVRAVSSYQACMALGWKPQQCRVMKVTDVLKEDLKEKGVIATTSESNTVITNGISDDKTENKN